eukprot:TRINITY_DN65326_c0_g1_i1.p1 TRINITY_DN65326_c0_g1~~TRINITY_DN65326_c0_g1_i1.p1  ORF type:complete len:291 (+),score=94.42 TRINITY_DN65326_c0_g1_i1:84-956(+)
MSDGQDEGGARMPGYTRPNLSSRLPGNLGMDHEQIQAAFAPGSYTSIAGLNDPRSSAERASERTAGLSTDAGIAFKAGTGMKRPFEEFKYATSPYDLLQEARSRERLDSQRAQEQLHGDQPFVAPGSIHSGKHEGCYEYQSDPYDTARDEQLRSKWIEEKKVLAGSFLPPGRDKGLSRPSRAMLTDMMTHLYKTLYDDWEDAKPAVFTTAEDLIVVYFALDNLRNDTGLLAYMNVMARRSPLVQAYELHKANEGWGIQTEDNHKMFTFRPPWVKERRFTNFRPAPPSEGS